MKKVIYSPVLKAIAVLLCVVSAGIGIGYSAVALIAADKYNLYSGDFYSDGYFANKVSRSMQDILINIRNDSVVREPNPDIMNYYIFIPAKGIELGDPALAQTDINDGYGLRFHNLNGEQEWENNISAWLPSWGDTEQECEVILSYKPEYVAQYVQAREISKNRFENEMIYFLFGCAAVIVLSLVYLSFVCGRRAYDDRVHLLLQDRLFPEVQLGIAFGIVVLLLCAAMASEDVLDYNAMNEIALERIFVTFCGICAGAAMAAVTAFFASVIRLVKNKSFVKSSLCALVLRYLWKLAGFLWKIFKQIVLFLFSVSARLFGMLGGAAHGVLSKMHYFADTLVTYRTAAVVSAGVIGLAAVAFVCGLTQSGAGFVIAALIGLFIAFKAIKLVGSFERISGAIRSMRSGSLETALTLPEADYFHELADSLNSIGEGVAAAVDKAVNAERMKSELITNVSHDLKTPLTSIISYSDLLCEMELSPEEANDYAEIIRKKSDRLKNLTQDLFDVSKVQSGNEQVEIERLDLSLLISQALGESYSVLENAGLVQAVKLDKELFINADGKKLSRVFENLIGNIVKYAQKGTRVFVTANVQGKMVRAEFKNTSATPIDFEADEITERFVRGDESRSTEGSGLGLAIAKSYTELCGGKFRVELDGDLFKVIVEFEKG